MKNFKNYLFLFVVAFLFSFFFQSNASAYDLNIQCRDINGSKITGFRYVDFDYWKWKKDWKVYPQDASSELFYFPDVDASSPNTVVNGINYIDDPGSIKYTVTYLDDANSEPEPLTDNDSLEPHSVSKQGLYFVTAEATFQYERKDEVILTREIVPIEGYHPWVYADYLPELKNNVDKDGFTFELLSVEAISDGVHPRYILHKRYTIEMHDSLYVYVGPDGGSAVFCFPWKANDIESIIGFKPSVNPSDRHSVVPFTVPWQESNTAAISAVVDPIAETISYGGLEYLVTNAIEAKLT
ncbi:MAG: hypothetical protein KAR20_09660, partial [Candidatus Heimdallarchaeota archaeon]|nr:hypothetical protein [Candidatus Heimdallarchaeota archaeon]